ncbi:MAG: NAD(P)/FAD-dependent oxidoreductase [Oscillospiraceae bacterium]|jgi:predicted Rossmann fold flavoprotein|nr:NAD(P)/FAD-dependent oxidoreductase [Oscillospiraceae bacterium]
MPSRYDALVIGGGAAGLICAGAAAKRGLGVLVLERMERPARKVGLTGKGRCNLTNDCEQGAFIEALRNNGRFLYGALSALSPKDMMSLIESQGVPLKTERGGRVFPASDKARDVVDALVRYAKSSGAVFKRERVVSLLTGDNGLRGVICESGREYLSPSAVIATGGLSYPATGSTGDGYRLAREAGHTVTPLRGSLLPIETREAWCGEASGLSLRNVRLTLTCGEGKKTVFEELGEMLFTHFGVSGPLVLSASAHMDGPLEDYALRIDLKPGLSCEKLDARLLRDFGQNLNRDFQNSLGALLPRAITGPLVRLSGIAPERKVNGITKDERRRLGELIKGVTLRPKALRPIEEAVVTAGGVSLKEINPGTMESKLLKGLFFAGEVLDLDARTGGFNLQIAFSTGYLAGISL